MCFFALFGSIAAAMCCGLKLLPGIGDHDIVGIAALAGFASSSLFSLIALAIMGDLYENEFKADGADLKFGACFYLTLLAMLMCIGGAVAVFAGRRPPK